MRSRKPNRASKSVKPLFTEPLLSSLRNKQAEHPSIYACGGCGAKRRHLIWGALGLREVEGLCPGCGGWTAFKVYTEAVEKAA